jgi:hypothetical protein
MTQTVDPFDELTSMFMTEGDAPPARAAGATTSGDATAPGATRAATELLVLGHLPVRAGLWVTPYADALARREGPTALVRLDGDEPMVQVLRGDAESSRLPTATETRSLRETILHLGRAIRMWIVRPSSRLESHELIGVADRITILSSADQASLVNTYRLVKDLVVTSELTGSGTTADASADAGPSLGLAIVGRDEEAARGIAGQIRRTAREHLAVEVPMVLSLPRIDASIQASALRSFPGQARPTLDAVIGWIEEARTHGVAPTPVAPEAPAAPAPMPPHLLKISHTVAPAPPPSAAPPAPAPPAPPDAPVEAPAPPLIEVAGGVNARTIPLGTRATMQVEPKRPAAALEPDDNGEPIPLARHAGLTPMAVRCPGHERVELGHDAHGRVHLLGREDELREMMVVETWARAHRELLAMACPAARIDASCHVACHVFTEEPVRVADLHGSRVHLHVLAPVEVDGRRAWYAAPLNRPARSV